MNMCNNHFVVGNLWGLFLKLFFFFAHYAACALPWLGQHVDLQNVKWVLFIKPQGLFYFEMGMFSVFHSFTRLVILSPLPFLLPPLLPLPPHTAVWCDTHSPVLCRWFAQWGSVEIQLLFPGYLH